MIFIITDHLSSPNRSKTTTKSRAIQKQIQDISGKESQERAKAERKKEKKREGRGEAEKAKRIQEIGVKVKSSDIPEIRNRAGEAGGGGGGVDGGRGASRINTDPGHPYTQPCLYPVPLLPSRSQVKFVLWL